MKYTLYLHIYLYSNRHYKLWDVEGGDIKRRVMAKQSVHHQNRFSIEIAFVVCLFGKLLRRLAAKYEMRQSSRLASPHN